MTANNPNSQSSKLISQNRRDFVRNVGHGMLAVGVGAALASDLGCSAAFALEHDDELTFGRFDRLVDLMQSTSPDDLQVKLVEQLNAGAKLDDFVAAAALANAESFGGQDYVGYHAEMALIPSLFMSTHLGSNKSALPVLKVLYRNTQRIQNVGGAKKKTLKPVEQQHVDHDSSELGQQLKQLSRDQKMDKAEELFAQTKGSSIEDRLNALMPMVEDDINVHRFVLAHRSMELARLVGEEYSQTILRQCVRYCVDEEQIRVRRGNPESKIRTCLPKLMDQYKLAEIKPGIKEPGDDWVEKMSDKIYEANAVDASDLVAAALAEGISPTIVGEAISLAANQLVLRQGAKPWRTHGASAGVHGSDAVNSWRNMIQFTTPVNTFAGLICAGFHTANYAPFKNDPYPNDAHLEKVKATGQAELLGIAEEAIRSNDQPTSAAAIHVYGEQGYELKPVLDLMLKYAISEDGRLHSEKYYQTVCQEYSTTSEKFRWRQIVALARVTASAYGYDPDDNHGHRAAGYVDACKLLGVKS